MPHGPGEVIIHEAEDSFHVAAGQSLRHLFHVPASYPGEPVLRTERPLSELSWNIQQSILLKDHHNLQIFNFPGVAVAPSH